VPSRGACPLYEKRAPVATPPRFEPRPVVRAEPAPHRQIVGAVEHIDGVELDPADVLHEPPQARRGEGGRVRPGEVLALEEERGDGAQRNARAWHAAELIIVVVARLPLLITLT